MNLESTPDSAPPPTTAFDIALRTLRLADIAHWLGLGVRDFLRAPWIGLFYGGCFVAMGWALLSVFRHAPVYVLALSAGFLLMGPFMCMGLYRVSQQLERGDAPHFIDSLLAWRTRIGTLAIFGFALLVLEMLWGRAALTSLRLVFSQTPVMLCWGATITGLVVLALLPWFLGLLVVGPVLGHATWHAYRAAVGDDPAQVPATR